VRYGEKIRVLLVLNTDEAPPENIQPPENNIQPPAATISPVNIEAIDSESCIESRFEVLDKSYDASRVSLVLVIDTG